MTADHSNSRLLGYQGSVYSCLSQAHQELNLIDTLSVGADRIQRNFEPMRRQVESWQQTHRKR